jgi:hypothetical protein
MFYLKAFYDLSTCRQSGFGPGPIPWDKIIQYGLWYGLDSCLIEVFVDIIREMDTAYLEHHASEQKKETDMNTTKRNKVKGQTRRN